MRCSGCKYRVKVKEPIGGLRTSGMRFCMKNGKETPLVKREARNAYGIPTGKSEYPIGCTGDGVPFYSA